MIKAVAATFAAIDVVYQARNISLGGDTIYVGTCKLADLARLPDAYRNSEFARLIQPADVIEITIIGYGTPDECTALTATFVSLLKPHCNLIGTPVEPSSGGRGKSQRVRNVGTGEIFDSLTKAAQSIDVTPQAISLHLKHGGSTVGGKHRFERVA